MVDLLNFITEEQYVKKIFLILLIFPFQLLYGQNRDLSDFPEACNPEKVGKLIAYRFVDAKHALHAGKWISYPETFYWGGAFKFASLTDDEKLVGLLQNRFEPLFLERKRATANKKSC